MGFGDSAVSRTTGPGPRARGSSQPTDRSGLSPFGYVGVEPGDGVLAESSALWKLAGELEAVDGHPRQSGELHYLFDA